jgi:hypothetical protein
MSTCYENDNSYFTYHGVTYCVGTEVNFSDNFIKEFRYEGKPIWRYARFNKRVLSDGQIMCLFTQKQTDWWWLKEHNMDWDDFKKTCGYFLLKESTLDNAIEEITKPITIEVLKMPTYTDLEVVEVMVGWFVYILVLFFSFIFTEWYLLWIVASLIFFSFRKAMLNR